MSVKGKELCVRLLKLRGWGVITVEAALFVTGTVALCNNLDEALLNFKDRHRWDQRSPAHFFLALTSNCF